MSENPPAAEGGGPPVEPPSAPAVDSRSGGDVAEAIGTAESGTALQETHTHPERTKSGEAHVEQVADDPPMTQGQRVRRAGAADASGPSPAAAGSGGAQSVIGARVSDRLAAGEPHPAGSPFQIEGSDAEANDSGTKSGDSDVGEAGTGTGPAG